MAQDDSPSEHETGLASVRRRRSARSSLVLGIAAGAVAGVVGVVLISVIFFRDPLPPLTEDALSAAQVRWEESGMRSYDMEIDILGRRAGKVQIIVRDGRVERMTRDGRAPAERRTWEAWTVESQFDMLATELAAQRDPARGYGVREGSEIILQAEFDSERGYPVRFRRQVLGTDLGVEWRVTSMHPIGEL